MTVAPILIKVPISEQAKPAKKMYVDVCSDDTLFTVQINITFPATPMKIIHGQTIVYNTLSFGRYRKIFILVVFRKSIVVLHVVSMLGVSKSNRFLLCHQPLNIPIIRYSGSAIGWKHNLIMRWWYSVTVII